MAKKSHHEGTKTRRKGIASRTPEKSRAIDLGLEVIEMVRKPGQTMTLRDIATVCGCHRNAIWLIEHNAIEKLKRALQRRERMAA